jgi:phosphomevalonate kinase
MHNYHIKRQTYNKVKYFQFVNGEGQNMTLTLFFFICVELNKNKNCSLTKYKFTILNIFFYHLYYIISDFHKNGCN